MATPITKSVLFEIACEIGFHRDCRYRDGLAANDPTPYTISCDDWDRLVRAVNKRGYRITSSTARGRGGRRMRLRAARFYTRRDIIRFATAHGAAWFAGEVA